MSIKAGGRVRFIAVGLCVCVAAVGLARTPSEAAGSQSESVSTGKTVKKVRYYKRHVQRNQVRTSQKLPPPQRPPRRKSPSRRLRDDPWFGCQCQRRNAIRGCRRPAAAKAMTVRGQCAPDGCRRHAGRAASAGRRQPGGRTRPAQRSRSRAAGAAAGGARRPRSRWRRPSRWPRSRQRPPPMTARPGTRPR